MGHAAGGPQIRPTLLEWEGKPVHFQRGSVAEKVRLLPPHHLHAHGASRERGSRCFQLGRSGHWHRPTGCGAGKATPGLFPAKGNPSAGRPGAK